MSGVNYLRMGEGDNDSNRRRRTVLKLIGLGALASMAGCFGGDDDDDDDTDADTDDLVEVHEFEFMGSTAEEGVEHETAMLAAEAVAEHTPLPAEFAPTRYSRMVDLAWFERDYDLWYSQSATRMTRLDPYGWGTSYLSDFDECAQSNIGGINDERLDDAINEYAAEMDEDARQELVQEFYEDINTWDSDQPFNNYIGIVEPVIPSIYNSELFEDPVSIEGLGFRNWWNFNEITPVGDETTLVTLHTRASALFNPFYSGGTNLIAHFNVHDTLVQLGKDGVTMEPHVATDWELEDDTTITFDLRDDVYFHDGEQLTAEDVAFTYEIMEESPWYNDGVQRIESSEVVDDTTVTVNLEEPFYAIWFQAFARIPLVPQHIWEPIAEETDQIHEHPAWETDDYIGSGHFEFDYWRPEDEIRLEANDDHFNPPEVDAIVMNVLGDTDAMLGELRAGTGHQTPSVTGVQPDVAMDVVEDEDHLEGENVLSLGQRNYFANVRAAPLNFDAVRAAITSVFPRQEIVREVRGEGAARCWDRQQSAAEFWYNQPSEEWGLETTGAERAIEILEDAGFVIEDDTIYYPPGEEPEGKELSGYGC